MDEAGVLRLRVHVRKPRHWRWALSTCASAPAADVRVCEDDGSVDLLLDLGSRPSRLPVPRYRKQRSDSALGVVAAEKPTSDSSGGGKLPEDRERRSVGKNDNRLRATKSDRAKDAPVPTPVVRSRIPTKKSEGSSVRRGNKLTDQKSDVEMDLKINLAKSHSHPRSKLAGERRERDANISRKTAKNRFDDKTNAAPGEMLARRRLQSPSNVVKQLSDQIARPRRKYALERASDSMTSADSDKCYGSYKKKKEESKTIPQPSRIPVMRPKVNENVEARYVVQDPPTRRKDKQDCTRRIDSGVYSWREVDLVSRGAAKPRRKRRRREKSGGPQHVDAMGSSASRQSGLAGRRAQSSGSLPRAAHGLCKERCGSLPNHLDCDADAGNGLDQGYGSERSPDEDDDEPACPCLATESSFEVVLTKGSRGLGLSVCGGVGSAEPWPGLVRVKRLFPQQPAWLCGRLQPGDLLLAVNGVSLVGLTDCQALEVLRRTPSRVVLHVCRPESSLLCVPPPPGQPPPPPRRDPHCSAVSSHHHLLAPPSLDPPSGEFDIMLTKVNRSLGFTLRKEDESVLGHYVRALVREPALSDGRIRPGDKIVAVNDIDISPMSHEEAVMFLRQCGDVVKLRLYRDEGQTPVSALSPTEEMKLFKPKPLLRKEARDMLTDLAVRKLSPGDSSYTKLRRVSAESSPGSSPRRRRLTKTPSSEVQSSSLERPGYKYIVSNQGLNSDSSEDHSHSITFTYSSTDSMRARGQGSSFSSTVDSVNGEAKPQRPNFLDLCGGNSFQQTTRKPRLIFGEDDWDDHSSPPEPAPGSPSHCYLGGSSSDAEPGSLPAEPVSMPPLSSTSSTSTAFSYRNPAYQSAYPSSCYPKKPGEGSASEQHASEIDLPGKILASQQSEGGAEGLLKWKGVVFSPDSESNENQQNIETTDGKKEDQIFMVELTRGWNSRLGFSLQGNNGHTYISAIYANSVAAKDGRLQVGDFVLMVNDENVEDMNTADVIDLLRKIRGTIGITVLRKCGPKPFVSSS